MSDGLPQDPNTIVREVHALARKVEQLEDLFRTRSNDVVRLTEASSLAADALAEMESALFRGNGDSVVTRIRLAEERYTSLKEEIVGLKSKSKGTQVTGMKSMEIRWGAVATVASAIASAAAVVIASLS